MPAADFALLFDAATQVAIPSLHIDLSQPLTIEAYLTPLSTDGSFRSPLQSVNRVMLRGGAVWSLYIVGENDSVAVSDEQPIVPGKRVHVAGVVADGQVSPVR